ncbi:MAG: class I SAM-dependent methyltransferase [Desulfobulbaceae bacterium]|nr:class I SAM-dependent methyltransferase [Desulfobulbaceae bacterium]
MDNLGEKYDETTDLYNRRYAGDYMDTDAYSIWAHEGLTTRQVLDTLKSVKSKPQQILDYGCGVGAWINLLAGLFPGARIHGVDISTTAIEKAKTKFPNHHFESFNGVTAPFSDAQFDLIFSYHVLEHVDDLDASIRDIGRMLRAGGYAVVIFPCGNKGSFLDVVMRLIAGSKIPAADGRTVLFFEIADGHVRRVTSNETVTIFEKNGFICITELFSGHFFGTIDWLCRGTGPAYINAMFSGQSAIGMFAKILLEITRISLLGINLIIGKKTLELGKKRNPLKQMAVLVVKPMGWFMDVVVEMLSALEWRLFKRQRFGTAQYLVFQKLR